MLRNLTEDGKRDRFSLICSFARNLICERVQRSFVPLKQKKEMFKIFIKHQEVFNVEERCAIVKKQAGDCDVVILTFPMEGQDRVFVDIVAFREGLAEKVENILTGEDLQCYFNSDLAMRFGFDVISLTSSSVRKAKKIDLWRKPTK